MPLTFPCHRLIFDLDGTLVDSAPDLTAALNHCLRQIGRKPLPPETVRHLVGRGARTLIERGLSETGGGDLDATETLLPIFLDYYREHVADMTSLFPGAAQLLDWADAQGIAIAVCTNKPQSLSEALLDALGLRERFQAVIGGDMQANKKPHPDHVRATMSAMGGEGPCVFIGDTEADVNAAKAAGIAVGVVTFGFSAIPPNELGADFLIDHFNMLPPRLAGPAHGP